MNQSNERRSQSEVDNDDELSDGGLPPLVEYDSNCSESEEGGDEIPLLVGEDESNDELPPLVEEDEYSSDDKLPKLIDDDNDDENWEDVSDSDDDNDENWEDISNSDDEGDDGMKTFYDRIRHQEALTHLVSYEEDDELPSLIDSDNSDDEYETSDSSSSDFDFPFFLHETMQGNSSRGGSGRGSGSSQRIIPPQLFMPHSLSDDGDEETDSDSDDEENSRDIQGVLHSSSRSGTHNKYWTQISSAEKSKLDTLYRNTQDSFKFNTTNDSSSISSSSSTNDSSLLFTPIGNGLQLSIHNMDEFLDDIIQLITSHSLRAMEVSTMFEYSKLSQKQVVHNRNALFLAIMLAIKIKYMKDL